MGKKKEIAFSESEKAEILRRWVKGKSFKGKLSLSAEEVEKLSYEELAKLALSETNNAFRKDILNGNFSSKLLESLDFPELSTLPFTGKLKK